MNWTSAMSRYLKSGIPQPDTFENFMHELISDWHTENRYYRLHLHQDLFGDWVLHRIWGSRKSRVGRTKVEVFNNFEEGELALTKLAKVRQGRGYLKQDE